MIKKIAYSEIDFDKYNNCLERSIQKNFYAKKEILDFLCDSWELLVFGDYEFVMPVPIKKKLGLKIVLNPLFCQQLGIFSDQIDQSIEQLFLEYFKNNYHYFVYPFNSDNVFEEELALKKNYVIKKTLFLNLKKKYYKGRKSSVKAGQHLKFKEVTLDIEITEFISAHFKGLEKSTDILFLHRYLQFLSEKKYLKLFGAFNDHQILNLAIIVEDVEKNYLLCLINDPENIKQEGASFLIDKILEHTIEHKDFSFMGSSMRGIEVFFKSFGSELQAFPILENNKKDLLISYFNRL